LNEANKAVDSMQMIDADRERSVRCLQLYLTVREATEFRQELDRLLVDAEADEHFHVHSEDASRDVSCSLVTPRKLAEGSYTDLERKAFEEP
jgi:hypothetical protein